MLGGTALETHACLTADTMSKLLLCPFYEKKIFFLDSLVQKILAYPEELI